MTISRIAFIREDTCLKLDRSPHAKRMQFDPVKIIPSRARIRKLSGARRVSRGVAARIGLVSIRLVSMQHFRGESENRARVRAAAAARAGGYVRGGSRNESYLRPRTQVSA